MGGNGECTIWKKNFVIFDLSVFYLFDMWKGSCMENCIHKQTK